MSHGLGSYKRFLLSDLLFAGLAVASSPALLQTGVPVDLLAPVDEIMQDAMQKYAIPGGALAIAKDGRLVFARGYGLADVAANEPVRADSIFRIQSITKTITATAVMRLSQQGKLNLDVRVFDLLELQPYNGIWGDPRLREITVRHLLWHAGGWDPDTTYDPLVYPILRRAADATGSEYPPSRESLIRYMLTQPLQYAPGTRYAYSNFGYLILGRVVEKVSGESFQNFVQQELLPAVNIQRFGIVTGGPGSRVAGEVRYYDYPQAPLEQSTYTRQTCLVPKQYSFWYGDSDGGMAMSVIDLVHLISSISGAAQPEVLSRASWDTMMQAPPRNLWLTPNSWYGFGLFVNNEAVGTIVSHTGLSAGSRTGFWRLPNGVIYAYAVNSNDKNDEFWIYLQQRLLPHLGLRTEWPEHDLFSLYFERCPNPCASCESGNGSSRAAPGPAYRESVSRLRKRSGGRVATRSGLR